MSVRARAVNAKILSQSCVWVGGWLRELRPPPPRSKFISCRDVENANKNEICRINEEEK
jgi:hypothetical protein